jgi:hypothetical protein
MMWAFRFEAFPELRVGREGRGQDFDGNGSIEAGVPGSVDFSHAASADGGLDFVRPKASSEEKAHGGRGRL